MKREPGCVLKSGACAAVVVRLFVTALVVALTSLSVSLPAFTSSAVAQEASAESKLSVAPAIIENTIDAGVTFQAQITVSNGTTRPTAFHTTIEGLNTDQPVDPDHAAVFDTSSWVKVDAPDFLLLGNEARTVLATISVPLGAEPGDHYATIYFEAFVPDQASASASTIVNGRVGVVVLLAVKGDVQVHAVAEGRVRTPGRQTEAGPTALGFDLRNEGNVHLEPSGSVTVRDVFGRKVKELKLTGGRFEGLGPTLLPGTKRSYNVSWEHGPRVGVYKAEATVTVGPAKDRISIASTYFILFPLVVVVPVAVAIMVVAVFLGWRLIRRRRRARDPGSASIPSESGSAP